MVHWYGTLDGDSQCLTFFRRHYSNRAYKDGRIVKLFVGPGQKYVLRTPANDALFVWRKFIDASGEQGVNCAVFRNESRMQSSQLIREADAIAWTLWPDSRLYTYVNPKKVRSQNPGYCFLMAGWRKCAHTTKGGLLIFEKLPSSPAAGGG